VAFKKMREMTLSIKLQNQVYSRNEVRVCHGAWDGDKHATNRLSPRNNLNFRDKARRILIFQL